MEKSQLAISLAVATHNEGKNIRRMLNSVSSWVDEIVIVDGESTDDTVAIARTFGAVIIEKDNPALFHINKEIAVEKCRGIWILQLDADEVITEALKQEILHETAKDSCNGYYIPRKNYFLGHWLRKGGQYPDNVIRLFKRGKGHFPQKSVHEQIDINGSVGYLKNPILHYSYSSLSEYAIKASRYTDLNALELKSQGISKSFFSLLQYFLLLPIKTFYLIFFRHLGFMDGVYGFLFAFLSACHFPVAYVKYLAITNRE